MNSPRKQTALLACAVGAFAFGLLSTPAQAGAPADTTEIVATWESMLPESGLLPQDRRVTTQNVKSGRTAVHVKKGYEWIRHRPHTGGGGGGGVAETPPEEPVSPFLP